MTKKRKKKKKTLFFQIRIANNKGSALTKWRNTRRDSSGEETRWRVALSN